MHLSTVESLLDYQVREPSHLLFNIEAARWPTQAVVSEQLTVSPAVPRETFVDANGNRFLRFDALPGPLAVHYKADVELHTAPQEPGPALSQWPVSRVPPDLLRHLLPTRYCESDLVSAFARQTFGTTPPGLPLVQAVVDWVHTHIAYRPGSTTSSSTALQVLDQRAGVCRDFAQVAITLCRALNVPARFVAGYVWFDEPPQDFHAVFEAWLEGRWVMFDPTGMAPVDRLVRTGTGADATEVAFCTIFGSVTMTRKLVQVLEHDARGPSPEPGAAAAAATPMAA